MFQIRILHYGFSDGRTKVTGIAQQVAEVSHDILKVIDSFFHATSRHSLDTADSGCNRAFIDDADHTDVTGVGHVRTTAQLDRRTEFHNTYTIAVFLAEQSHGAHLAGLLNRHVAALVKRHSLADAH